MPPTPSWPPAYSPSRPASRHGPPWPCRVPGPPTLLLPQPQGRPPTVPRCRASPQAQLPPAPPSLPPPPPRPPPPPPPGRPRLHPAWPGQATQSAGCGTCSPAPWRPSAPASPAQRRTASIGCAAASSAPAAWCPMWTDQATWSSWLTCWRCTASSSSSVAQGCSAASRSCGWGSRGWGCARWGGWGRQVQPSSSKDSWQASSLSRGGQVGGGQWARHVAWRQQQHSHRLQPVLARPLRMLRFW
ncbi:hypothetical protein V8C86DRAFT_2747280 [Haematococcus lacustris]